MRPTSCYRNGENGRTNNIKVQSIDNTSSTTKRRSISDSDSIVLMSLLKSNGEATLNIDFSYRDVLWYRAGLTNDKATDTNARYWTERGSKFKHVP